MQGTAYLQQRLQQVYCQIAGHENCQLMMICTRQDCKESNIVCHRCYDAHRSHSQQLVDILEIQLSFKLIQNSNDVNDNQAILNNIQKEFDVFSHTKWQQMMDEVNQVLGYSELIKHSFLNLNTTSYSELRSQVKQFLTYFEYTTDGRLKLKSLQQLDIKFQINAKLKNFQQELVNFWSQQQSIGNQNGITNEGHNLQGELDNQRQYEKVPLQMKLDQFCFSQEFCSPQIKCFTTKNVLEVQYDEYQKLVLIQLEQEVIRMEMMQHAYLNLQVSIKSSHLLQSQIHKLEPQKSHIGIGIPVIKAQNFIFGQPINKGHGIYMVLNNKIIYNTDIPEKNRILGSVELREGKKYWLTFDPTYYGKEFKNCKNCQMQFIGPQLTMLLNFELQYNVFVYIGGKAGEIELLCEI